MVKFYYQIKTEPKKTAMDTITKREELYEKEKDCINDFVNGFSSYNGSIHVRQQCSIWEAGNVSGTSINDRGPSAFKTSIESEIQSVSNESKSIDDFLSVISKSCK